MESDRRIEELFEAVTASGEIKYTASHYSFWFHNSVPACGNESLRQQRARTKKVVKRLSISVSSKLLPNLTFSATAFHAVAEFLYRRIVSQENYTLDI